MIENQENVGQHPEQLSREGKGPEASSSKRPHPIQRTSKPNKLSAQMDWILLIASFLILMCIIVGGFGFLVLTQSRQQLVPLFAEQPMGDPMTHARQTLPPTWTATITNTPFPSATFIPAYTPRLSIPNPLIKQTGPITGLFAPDFLLNDVISGNQVSLSNYNGQPVLLFIWATWCPHCANEVSSVQSVYGEYKGKGLVILAVDVGESVAKARSYRSARCLTFTMLNDSSQTVATKYRVTGFPTHFFVASNGQISSIVVGEINQASLVSKLDFIQKYF